MTTETTTGDGPEMLGSAKIAPGAIAPDHPADRPDDPSLEDNGKPVFGPTNAAAPSTEVLKRLAAIAIGISEGPAGDLPVLRDVPPELHTVLFDIMKAATRDRGVLKNVIIEPDTSDRFATTILGALDAETLCRIPMVDPAAIRLAAAVIDHVLDIVGGMRVLHLLWQAEGYTKDLDIWQFWGVAHQWARRRIAHDMPESVYWWDTPMETVFAYYRVRFPPPFPSVRYPENQAARVLWQLDSRAFTSAINMHGTSRPQKSLRQLMPHCPGLPGKFQPDGKAVSRFPDGAVFTRWYSNGKRHRDPKDGPAFHSVEPDREVTKYIVEGALHRDSRDGPALVDTNRDGTSLHVEEYYEHGKLHRPAGEGPAALHTNASGRRVFEAYAEHGELHRPSNEGPAVRQTDQEGNCLKEAYWEHGKVHRDPADGPAWVGLEDGQWIEAYMLNGVPHRPGRYGPAITFHDPETGRVIREEYYLDGKLHRDHRDGPAIIDTAKPFEGLTVRLEEFYTHGKRHRPSCDGPAVIHADSAGNCAQESYFEHDKCHRDPVQGPAWKGLEDGKHIEAYFVNGRHHRPETAGPAVAVHDAETGRPVRREYHLDGQCHRLGGPAYVEYGPDGSSTYECWYRHGEWHRDPADGPALCMTDVATGNRSESFFVAGQLHREPAEGPAFLKRSRSGDVIQADFYVDGEKITGGFPDGELL